MCFIVAGLRLSGVAVLISLLASVAVAALLAELVRRGFRDGDLTSDPTVEVHSLAADPEGEGTWVEVSIDNRSPAVALVGLRLHGLRRPRWWPSPAVARRGGSHRPHVAISELTVGAIAAGETGRFWLWADGRGRPALEARIGTPNRLRRHRLSVPPAADARGASLRRPTADSMAGRRSGQLVGQLPSTDRSQGGGCET